MKKQLCILLLFIFFGKSVHGEVSLVDWTLASGFLIGGIQQMKVDPEIARVATFGWSEKDLADYEVVLVPTTSKGEYCYGIWMKQFVGHMCSKAAGPLQIKPQSLGKIPGEPRIEAPLGLLSIKRYKQLFPGK